MVLVLVVTAIIGFHAHMYLTTTDRTLGRKSALDERRVILLDLDDLRDHSSSTNYAYPRTLC